MQSTSVGVFRQSWLALCGTLEFGDDTAAAVGDVLLTQYGGADRHYHNVQHIVAMLQDLAARQSGFHDPGSAALAIFFHDFVYDPARADNEARSAEAMVSMLSNAGVSEYRLDKAADIIHATKAHARAADADTNLVLDMDMAILGQPWPVYVRYAKGVMQEYLAVHSKPAYRLGRVNAFLDPVIAHGDIFLTPDFQPLTTQAIDNMRRERALLQAGEALA